MQRIHHTNRKSIRIPYSVSYKQEIENKPQGLWYDIDLSWLEWCKAESFAGRLRNQFELKLDLKKILVINTAQELINFNKKFRQSPDWAKNVSFPYVLINWKKVAEKYSGIEIAPYPYKFRFDRNIRFIYTWDVASGCIWDLNAIKSVKQIKIKK